MTSKIEFSRNELNLVVKSRGIKKHRSMSIDELINALYKYDRKGEVENSRKKLLKMNLRKLLKYKIFQNISKNNLSRVEELQNKATDELRGISRLRGNEPKDKLTKKT